MMKLRHIASVRNSNVDKITNTEEIPVRLCNYVDVYKNDFIQNDMSFMAGTATEKEIHAFRLRVGDVIITKDSEDYRDIGVPALVQSTSDDVVCGYHLTMLRPDTRLILGEYMFWALQAQSVRDAFSNAAYGVTRYGLSLGAMKSIEIPVPDLDTQRTIADFLDRETARIDALIEKKRQLSKLANERLSAALENLTFGDPSFKGMMIPFKWVCRITEGQVDPTTEVWKGKPLIAPNHIEKGTGRLSAVESADEQGAISGKYAFPAGTVLYSKIRPALMKACIAPEAGLCSADMYPILPGSKLLPEFLLMQLLSKSFTDWAVLESMRVAMPKINRERLGSVRLVVPPLSDQRKAVTEFTRIRTTIDRFVDLTLKSVTTLTELRSSLITAAVTGQIDPATYQRKGTTDRTLDRIEKEMST